MGFRLHILGAPRLIGSSGTVALERKTAAVLAYLAVEGPTSKYKLAGWLWPESGETTARNNMRQLLRRLRLSGAEVITGEDPIALSPEVEVDIRELSYLEAPTLELLRREVVFLEGLDYDDLPEFAEWLESVREELRELRSGAAKAEAERLEGLGDFRAALEYAQIHLGLEPLSEEASRQTMRLHYLLGDRGAALAAFERLKETLQREFAAEPLPETLELVRLIERGAQLGNAPARKSPAIPVAVLRPPVLAGREREWAQMEQAWDAGRYIAIGGEGGSGKTRLMLDFIYSKVPKEAVLHLQDRPGDAAVPYSSHARNFWQMIQQFKPDLEPWVVRELARIIPELGESPGPIGSPAEKLRFYQAKLEAMRASMRKGLRVLASDDVQYTDAASAEAALYMMGAMGSTTGGLAAIYCYRPTELSPQTAEVFAQSVSAGLLEMVLLEPLAAEGIETLLEGLGLDETENLVPGLSRYTGGNPQFVLETLKYLMETGNLERGLPARLAPLGQVASLIGRRLGRLSPTGLNLARVAAVAGTQFTLELAAYVLERPSLELIETVSELEAAQILKGTSFTHDLVFEAVLLGIPAAVRLLLHARVARYLETVRGNPALVAQHWLEAEQPAQAAPWLLAAARLADANGLPREAVEAYGKALEILLAQGDAPGVAAVRAEVAALEARVAVG